MATPATAVDFYKTVTTAGTPVVLGSSSVKVSTITFAGNKSAKTENTGVVYIRPVGGTGWMHLYPGQFYTYDPKEKRYWTLDKFEIDSANNGDGVYATYQPHLGYDGP